MKIFISHINEDEKLALSLKEWIEKSFLGQIDVFVSSDSEDIVAGDRWFNDIENFFLDTSILIILTNKISISRPWICFEAGAGWIKKLPIIPICFAGLTKSQLPLPFSIFQAINLSDSEFSKKLFSSISVQFNFPAPPNINYEKMNKEMLIKIGDYFDENELGLLDHMESMENGFKELVEVLGSITIELTNMTLETEKLTTILNSEAKHPSQGSAKYLQKHAKKLADKINKLHLTVSIGNENYNEINQRIDKNLEFIYDYSRPSNDDGINALLSSLAVIEGSINTASEAREQIHSLSNTMKLTPKFEKNLKRSLNKASEALDNLCESIDDNTNVMKKAKIRGENIIQDFNKNRINI